MTKKVVQDTADANQAQDPISSLMAGLVGDLKNNADPKTRELGEQLEKAIGGDPDDGGAQSDDQDGDNFDDGDPEEA